MRVKWVIGVAALLAFCATPLASARSQDLPSGTVTLEATGPSGAEYSWDTTGYTCDRSSPGTFAIGNTTVTCDDGAGGTPSFVVTVQDTTPPVVTPPSNVSVSTGDPTGTNVTYGSASATDAVAGSPPVNCSPSSGSKFSPGTTTVTCSASDGTNTGSATFSVTVTVVDMTPPTLSGLDNKTAEATGPTGASVGFSVTASDNVDPSPQVSCNHLSGETFPLGTTTVTCHATDASGNQSNDGSFTITVRDTTGPTINTPANISTPATGLGGATVSYGPVTATDIVDGTVTASCSPPSGTTFGVGTSTVTCTAQDSRGNHAAPSSFTVAVVDNVPPTVTPPANVQTEADSSGGKHVSYGVATATDNVDGSLTPTCSPASGSLFPVGNTTVTCNATDSSGNKGSASFTVTVTDTTAPALSLPANQTLEATSPLGAVANFSATATDLGATVPVTCIPASGSTFTIQATTVNCSANDGHGNTASGQFKVTVQDTTDPVLGLPSDQTAEATSPSGAAVSFSVSATDLGQSVGVSCNHNSGDTFPIANTTVSCTANDGRGNSASGSFHVLVRDTIQPVLTLPSDITRQATVSNGTPVTFSVTASDLGQSLSANCNPSSGSTFPITTTTVNCSANDGRGNTANGSFHITVMDTTKPVLSNVPADITREANSPAGSNVTFTSPTAVDLGVPLPLVTCLPGSSSTFPLGKTKVTCSATDASGNIGTAEFTITVVDTTPPTLIPPGDTTLYATQENGADAADQVVAGFVTGYHVADIADPHPKVIADNPTLFPLGTTVVHYTATDASGNKATGSASLTVLPKPAPGTTPPKLPPPKDNIPPANVKNFSAKAGDRKVTLKWTNPTDQDFTLVEIDRTTNLAFNSSGAAGSVIYRGKATSYVDKGLTNGVEYRYVIKSVDKNENKSNGVVTTSTPFRALLRTPPDGARLAAIPKRFIWTRDAKASYYNFQLYVGGTLLAQSTSQTAPKKILSTWTNGPSLTFKSPWKWEGRNYKMTKGIYTWYVWPGYGARADVKYGALMGSATFQLTKSPKPPKKPKKPKAKK